ncbi:MAG: nucleotidyltransferase family protein [Polyangiaceae bacterium]|nr:nucleotidyltransferase family protein [Polyangiaceae bacterium]
MQVELDARAALGARLLADSRLREAAATFLGALAARGVAAAPIKGLVVSALLYDDPIERPFGDVDVLVGRRDLGRVAAIARDAGWRIVRDSRQLLTLNVVIPPGIPMDVRASIGPPPLSRWAAAEVLARAAVTVDPRVVACPFRLLDGHDHLLLLLLDAVFDKLALRSELRKVELARALRRWVEAPARFAERARAAGLATIAWTGLEWLRRETGDGAALEALRALGPAPAIPGVIASRLIEPLRRDPYGPAARLGVRLLADSPVRGLAALALGAVGTARYHARHRGRDPWAGVVWQGR